MLNPVQISNNNKIKKVEMFKSYWFIWLFPIIAIGICGWLVYKHVRERGPIIYISFDDAAGMQAQKTKVRFRGVDIGIVKDITISDDTKKVTAEIELHHDADSFAVHGAKFWIVTAKVSVREITGLDTFLGGTYIAGQPGAFDADEQHEFKATASTDSAEEFENTTAYFVETPNAESLNAGDSVTYRGLEIGNVRHVTLTKNSQNVSVQVQIHSRYLKLIRTNTAFWKKVGVQAKLGLFGSEVKLNSVDSILHGGIELSTPDNPGPSAKPLSHFGLLSEAPKDSEKWNPKIEL